MEPEVLKTPQQTPTPNTPSTPKILQTDPSLRPLRTYERDVAEMIRSQEASIVSISLAEQKRKEELPVEDEPYVSATEKITRNTIFFVVSIILVVASVSIFIIFYSNIKNKTETIKPNPISTPIPINDKKEISVDGLVPPQIVEKIKTTISEYVGDDTILHIQINTTDIEMSSTTEATAKEFFEDSFLDIPTSLTRAFDKKMFAGVYMFAKRYPFFIINIDSFDNAFAGMLLWEKDMYTDIGAILDTRAVSDTDFLGTPLENFEDVVIQNKDTRVLKDNQGEIIVVYSFIDQKTLLITQSELGFKEVLNRFNASKFVR